MKNLILLNVYDDNDNIVKQAEATPISIKYGAIRKIMKLLKVDKIENTVDILNTVNEVWEELTVILAKCFPDMTEEDFDNVKLEELIPAVIAILRYSFAKLSEVPSNEKN